MRSAHLLSLAAFNQFVNAEPMQRRLTALGQPLLVIFGTRGQIAIGERNDPGVHPEIRLTR
jgi:hypothetical protein